MDRTRTAAGHRLRHGARCPGHGNPGQRVLVPLGPAGRLWPVAIGRPAAHAARTCCPSAPAPPVPPASAQSLRPPGPCGSRAASGRTALLYGRRPVSEWAVAAWREREADLGDDREKLEAFEQEVIVPLDQRAAAIITAATRRSGFINVLSPFAVFDMLATALIDLRMVARLARLYGGRPGGLASLRLLRIAFLDVLAAGTLEAADETLGDLVGASVTARLSGKAGAALVNGLFTARLGLAAAEACRPMDWQTARPSARRLVMKALYPGRSEQREEG
ncbi:TIGR01620 family protein [Fodinicurvata halophila]|uniref:TIGR01620 family protein n=1 Tax=Fodinicurvata halophila TaxID=1419723 RepID=UPI003627B766